MKKVSSSRSLMQRSPSKSAAKIRAMPVIGADANQPIERLTEQLTEQPVSAICADWLFFWRDIPAQLRVDAF